MSRDDGWITTGEDGEAVGTGSGVWTVGAACRLPAEPASCAGEASGTSDCAGRCSGTTNRRRGTAGTGGSRGEAGGSGKGCERSGTRQQGRGGVSQRCGELSRRPPGSRAVGF